MIKTTKEDHLSQRLICLFALIMMMALPGWTGSEARADNRLYIEPVVGNVGKTVYLPVILANDDEVVAAQFDIELPYAMPSTDVITMSNRQNGHAVSSRINGQTVTVLLSSMENKAIKGNSGILLRIPMSTYDKGDTGPYPIVIRNIVLTNRHGDNIATETTSESSFTVSKTDCPDLTVNNVSVASTGTTLMPGSNATFSYTVNNIGTGATNATYTAMLYLESESTGVRTIVGTQTHDTMLAAGASTGQTQTVMLPPAMHIEGTVRAVVEIVPSSKCGELIVDQGNNIGYSADLTLGKMLYLTTNRTTVTEGDSHGYATLTITRSGDWTVAENFTVSSSVSGLLCTGYNNYGLLPATVVIPKGSASASVRIYSVNDNIVRAKECDIIAQAAHGYESKSLHILRYDNDHNPLSLTLSKQEITEGESLTLTATRGGELTDELTLNVACSDMSRFEAIPTLTFPAGQSKATVTINSTDDNIPQLDKSIRLSVRTADYQQSTAYVTLNDNDRPTVTLTLSPASIIENAGNSATTAIISRTGSTEMPLKVKVLSSRSEVFTGSAIVQIPAGEQSVEIPVGIDDNSTVDGNRECTMTATAFIEADNCYAPSTDKAYSAAQLTIYDDESPYLMLTSRSTTIAEGSYVTVTVSRITSSYSGDLTISLTSNDASISLPSSVTIPSGHSYTNITVKADKNTTSDDDRYATITANGNGFGQGMMTLRISDRTLPDAAVASVSHEGELYSGMPATFSVAVQNAGTQLLPKGVKIDFYLASDSRLTRYTTSTHVLTATLDRDLEIGDEQTFTFTANVPEIVGTRWLYAIVNSDNTVNEFSTSNNIANEFEQVHVNAPFAVTEISTDKTDYLPGEYVQVTGKMEGKLNGQTVRVSLIPSDGHNNGQYTYTDTKIDANGHFTASVLVDRSAYGDMNVVAGCIGQTEPAKTTTVNVYNISLYSINGGTNLECNENYPVSGTIRIYNRSAKQITGVTLSHSTLPFGCGLTFSTVPSTINASGYADVKYNINPTVGMATQTFEPFSVVATCSEGLNVELPFRYLCRSTSSNLGINPSPLNTTLLLGSSRTVEIKITNYGLKESGKIVLSIPADVTWLSSLTPAELPSLLPGESTTIRLQLTHREGMHSGRTYMSQLNVNDENGVGKSVKINVTVVGTEYSTLTVHAKDVYSLANNDYSKVNMTAVTVQNSRGETVFTGFIGNDGKWKNDKITEGGYTVTLRGLRHKAVTKTVNIGPGEDVALDVVMPYQAVLANFVTTMDLETNTYKMTPTILIDNVAPQAIVVPTFGEDDFNETEGTVDVVIQNVGNRTAIMPRMLFPTSIDGVSINVTNGYPATLNPGERYVLNIHYTCQAGMKRRIIASMVMNYSFNIDGIQLSESDIYQQLVGRVDNDTPENPEPAPVVDPTMPNDNDDSESENHAESEEHHTGTALPSIDGWATLTFEDIDNVKTGQPIHATLNVRNGSDKAMTKLRFIHDAFDADTDDRLSEEVSCNVDKANMTNFVPSGNAMYTLAANEEGSMPLLFAASENIAPDGSRKILLSGQLTYTCGGIQTTAAMPYIVLTISPAGKAEITYLVQRDYIGDDPATDIKEDSRLAEIVMMVRNMSSVSLGNVTISNNNPTIQSNSSMASVAYSGLYSSLDNEEGNYDFTKIVSDVMEAGMTKTYHWMYSASEMAHVDNIANIATEAWVDGNGNDVTIEDAYELVRSVCSAHAGNTETSTAGTDEDADCPADIDYQVKAQAQTDAYLVDMVEDEKRLPDAVFTSASPEPQELEIVSDDANITGTNGVYTLTVKAKAAGWVYGEIHDPTNGVMMLSEVRRSSDGVVVSAANFWQTDRTVGADYTVINENILHFADCISGTDEIYTLTFMPRANDRLKATTIHLLTADGTEIADGSTTKEPVTSVRIEFNKDVRQVYVQYVNLLARGEMQNLGDNIITRNNYRDYTVSLKNVAPIPGLHEFTVMTNKLKEKAGGALGEGTTVVTWTEDTDAKVMLDIAVAPNENCGELSKVSGEYSYGPLEIEATPTQGYALAYWTINGVRAESADSKLMYNVEEQAAIRAYFTKKAYEVTVENTQNGDVTGAVSGIYDAGETITFVAKPHAGFVVDKWIINGLDYSESNDMLTLAVNDNTSVKAVFKSADAVMELSLAKGWNWVSHYLSSAVKAEMLVTDNVDRMLSLEQEVYRDDQLGIVGNMDDISAETGLKIHAMEDEIITLSGKLYDPKMQTVNLEHGWNWVGYPLDKTMSLTDALSNLNAEEGDMITNIEDGFAQFYDDQWNGTLSEMRSGQCYLYKSASMKQFRYNNMRLCSATGNKNRAVYAYTQWNVDAHAYPSMMCITAILRNGDNAVMDGSFMVGAFIDGECRGTGTWVNGRLYIPVHGDEKTAGTVKLVAVETVSNKQYNVAETFSFIADAYGSTKSPVVLNVSSPTTVNTIDADGIKDERIYNLSGQKLDNIKHSGVYIIGKKKAVKR